ncbi:hypothetical protein CRG98_039941 [Punica granatum]|uniref:Uncharacterized protein n=1 Tax=Punica granatum TaxID=22663 RepID=A0A2I0I6S3_PUNGR|nr:hypothetical protein CRG98_039941 [Punica granatum]
MLDHLRRVLGGDGPIAVFTGDVVACECCCREAVLWVGLTLGTKTYLVSEKSGNCTWLTHIDGQNFPIVMWTVVCAECVELMLSQRSALLLGWLLVTLPNAGSAARAIVVRWGCPRRKGLENHNSP